MVGEGVVSRVDSELVAMGTTPVADSSEVVIALSVALVTTDSTVPVLVDEASEADEILEPVDEALEADEPTEPVEEASESDDAFEVADASPVADDCMADVASPDPTGVDSVLPDSIGIGTIGMMGLLLEVVLPDATVDGFSVG